jgi:hypothetical protein
MLMAKNLRKAPYLKTFAIKQKWKITGYLAEYIYSSFLTVACKTNLLSRHNAHCFVS